MTKDEKKLAKQIKREENRIIKKEEKIVIPITGSGLKEAI